MSNVTTKAPSPRALKQYDCAQDFIEDVPRIDVEKALPVCFKPLADRFLTRAQIYMATCKHSWKLFQCTPSSVIKAILSAAGAGLFVDGKQGHLVPFKNTAANCTEAQFMPDYKGLVAAGRRHGAFVNARAELVCEGDVFKWAMVDGRYRMRFVRAEPRNRGKLIKAFAVINQPTYFDLEVMDFEELEYIRSKSKAKDDGPWKDWTDMMYRKSVLLRAIRQYADDADMLELIGKDDAAVGLGQETPNEELPEEMFATPTLPRLDGQPANKPLPGKTKQEPGEQQDDGYDYSQAQETMDEALRQKPKATPQKLRQPIDRKEAADLLGDI